MVEVYLVRDVRGRGASSEASGRGGASSSGRAVGCLCR